MRNISDPLHTAFSQIPDDYEKLLEHRNVQRIKAVMFKKATHEAVASNVDAFFQFAKSMRQFANGLPLASSTATS